ncbi:hypothetical protein CLPUN_39740 [Clostridium puniceum]|uniref:Uncharacterized protein n=1 Tax=Clostridium puniceum TaxID=29367 RepID=A0A1S8T9G2_9CLOT|nr:hypothetical protein [Clostridium puniceum]OOM74269.1 hypothetical protein CLPUN_39740 [Clostridium puniceum]
MSDNRIISRSKYVVNGVTRITVENSITKRPYAKTDVSSDKRHNNSNSFNDNLHSKAKKKDDNDNSLSFSNELDNMLRLKSEENSRLVQARFNHNILIEPKPINNPIETELHNKLGQAMGEGKIDTATLTKKIELLNALRNESK